MYIYSFSRLKRFEAISKSPIFSHFGETLTGLSTIKGYKMEENFIKSLDNKIDQNSKFFYILNYTEK